MDQPCSGKTEISRNCGVRERKHAAVVELQMSWVSDTRFPSAWEKSWKHKQPLGNESFSSSSSQWLPTHKPCSTQRTQPTMMPSFRKGGPSIHISWDGSREGKPAAPALEFYSLFYFNYFKLIPKSFWELFCLGHLGFSCCQSLGTRGWWCPTVLHSSLT